MLVPEAQGPAPGPGTGGSDTGHRGPGARGPEARGWGPGPGPEPRGSRLGLGAGSPRHCSAIWRGSIQPCHAQPLRHLARLLFWTARSHPGRGPAVTARGGLLRRRRMRTTLSRRGWRSNQERLASARVPLVKCQAPRQRLGMKLFFRTSGLRHGRTLARVSIWVRGRPRAVSRTWAGPGCALISFDLFRSPSRKAESSADSEWNPDCGASSAESAEVSACRQDRRSAKKTRSFLTAAAAARTSPRKSSRLNLSQ